MIMGVVIETEDVFYKVGAKKVLQSISLHIESGDRCILFGLNGSGKTSLLSILAGYQSCSSGTLKIFGEEPAEENIFSIRQKIGWVSTSFFERFLRFENILDIVLAGLQGTFGISEDVCDADVRKAKRLLTQLGLKKEMRYTYDMLSRGQKQKVLLARAMMSSCDFLILDEPCSGLDILSKAKVQYELEKFLAEDGNRGCIYVAHHTDEILPFFNKAILLKNGKIHSQGEIETVFSEKNLSEYFELPVRIERTQAAFNFWLDASEIDLSRY